ncbi:MAG: hypothetical protein ABJ081_06880 [Hyphomicrobiales bacterium]
MFQKRGFFTKSTALMMFSLVASGCSISNATYGTGQTAGGALAKDISSIATFGFLEGSDAKTEISYHDRQPLAVPSKEGFKSLPRPITGFSADQIALKRETDAFEREFLAEQERLENKPPLTEAERRAEEEALFEKQLLEEQRLQEEARLAAENPPKKKSVFRRLIGKSVKKDNSIRSNSELAELPPEYRVPKELASAPTVDPLAKKKKKKRFLLF